MAFVWLTNILGYWETWFTVITSTVPTMWTLVSSYTSGLPAYQIILYTGEVFAFFTGGAVFFVWLCHWAQQTIGAYSGVAKSIEAIGEMRTRNHKDISISQLAELWSGYSNDGVFDHWRRWNMRLRDLKDAADADELVVTEMPNGTKNMNALVSLDSAMRFFESGTWRKFAMRR